MIATADACWYLFNVPTHFRANAAVLTGGIPRRPPLLLGGIPVASISSFASNRTGGGLLDQDGAESEVFLGGEGLDDMYAVVQAADGTGSTWSGKLSKSVGPNWYTYLQCKSSSGPVTGAINTGEPGDVSITVKVGTDPAITNPAARFTTPVAIKRNLPPPPPPSPPAA